MRWLRRSKASSASPGAAAPAQPDITLSVQVEPVLTCASCGRPLKGDDEDEPEGDAGQPICGECNRARNFDAIEREDWPGW